MRVFCVLIVAGYAILWPQIGSAHDSLGLNHQSMVLSMDTTLNGIARMQPPSEAVRSVLVNLNKWPYSQLKACFYEGNMETRKRIIAAAGAWLSLNANIQIDFGAAPEFRTCAERHAPNQQAEDIRIGFRDARGYWSYIGLDAHRIVGPTMNLRDFDRSPLPEPEFSRIVRHEFGHALGFHHEHQSPGVNCQSEFDIPKIKMKYNWSDEDIRTNILVLQKNSKMYTWSRYDPRSIMMYSLDPDLLHRGAKSRCYVAQNDTLSDQDKRSLLSAYPITQSKTEAMRNLDALAGLPGTDSVRELLALKRALLEVRK